MAGCGPGRPVTTLPAGVAGVALTFDDGPGPFTPAILDVLAAEGVGATFFVTGAHVLARPDLAARVTADGHLLGNHTFSHPQDVPGAQPRGDFDRLPLEEQARQLDETAAAIVGVGAPAPRFFRGPGGRHDAAATAALAGQRGMVIVHWSVDTVDWRQPGRPCRATREAIVARATDVADGAPGPILLLHDGKASAEPECRVSAFRGSTVAALPEIIRFHRDHGRTFCDPAGGPLPHRRVG